jgi:hypothetical protein
MQTHTHTHTHAHILKEGGKGAFSEPSLGKDGINTHTLAAERKAWKPGDKAKFNLAAPDMFTAHVTTIWHGRKKRKSY